LFIPAEASKPLLKGNVAIAAAYIFDEIAEKFPGRPKEYQRKEESTFSQKLNFFSGACIIPPAGVNFLLNLAINQRIHTLRRWFDISQRPLAPERDTQVFWSGARLL